MKKFSMVLLLALVTLTLAPALHTQAAGKVVRLTLIDQNGSGEDGSAQLTDQGDGTTKVELIMMNAPDGALQPAHIHKGTCAVLDPVPAYPLSTVTGGTSTTVVKVALADLLKEKYAINVHKSAAEISAYVSCGNLPTDTGTTGPLTVAPALAALLGQAQDMAATIDKHEADASQAAYVTYHATFAANEAAIKAQDAAIQTTLDDAMTAVKTALDAGDWTKSSAAAAKLVTAIQDARGKLGLAGSPNMAGGGTNPLTDVLTKLQSGANDLVRETGNKDKAGAQAAYDAFQALFTTNDAAIKAQDATLEGNIAAPLAEVHDALAAGDWTKAAASSKEIQGVINSAMQQMGISSNTLPTTGNGLLPGLWLALVGAALALLSLGAILRRRAAR